MDHGLIRNEHNSCLKKAKNTTQRCAPSTNALTRKKRCGWQDVCGMQALDFPLQYICKRTKCRHFTKPSNKQKKHAATETNTTKTAVETQATQKQNPEHWCLLHSEQLARLFQDGRANDW